MDEILIGNNHRYYIESLIKETSVANIYRAFSRRRVGNKIKRRYYAVVERRDGIPENSFNSELANARILTGTSMFIADEIQHDGVPYIVLAKGKDRTLHSTQWSKLYNHGYLMLFLSALIFILLIVKFFQDV